LPLPACFTAALDPEAAGAFACEQDEDCPDEGFCVNARCERADPPTVDITNPEQSQAFMLGDAPPPMRTVTITITGTLDLVDPTEHKDNVFGEGHLELFVENESVVTITSGALSGGVQHDIEIPNVPGPVRVAVHALRNDGSRYDNEEATSRLLFWIDGGDPLVGIRNPWPGSVFGLEAENVAIEAEVLHFSLLPAMPGAMSQEATGHIHIYYDVDLATCFDPPMGPCDSSYKTTITTNAPSNATFPKSAAGTAKLSAVLRNIDHSLYRFPPPDGMPVTDEIEITRE